MPNNLPARSEGLTDIEMEPLTVVDVRLLHYLSSVSLVLNLMVLEPIFMLVQASIDYA